MPPRRERRAARETQPAGGGPYCAHPDWEGSWRLASSSSRTATGELAYSPYGAAYAGTGPDAFTGQWVDTPDNLNDFQHRLLAPMMDRWLSPDPAGIAAVSPASPQSWNAYAYVGDTPLEATDPLGLMTTPDPSALYTESQDYVLEATGGFEGGENEFTLQSIPVRLIGEQSQLTWHWHGLVQTIYVDGTLDAIKGIGWYSDDSIVDFGSGLFGGPDPAGIQPGSDAFSAQASPQTPIIGPYKPPLPPRPQQVTPGCMTGALIHNFVGDDAHAGVTLTVNIGAAIALKLVEQTGPGDLLPGPGWLYAGVAVLWDAGMVAKSYLDCRNGGPSAQ